jgi:phosphoglucosamine mutase
MSHASVQSAVAREDEALSGRGRVLVRASGTEPLIRVMVEAPSAEETEQICARLTDAVRQVIGPGKDGA